MTDDVGGDRSFGGYRLLEPLADGDTDQLVRAHDPDRGQDVALRVLAPRPGRRERFLRELPVVARLTEPHLVPVTRYGEVAGRLFVASEPVAGEPLEAVLARTGRFEPARAVDLVGQLARALDAVAAAGLAHRDVGAASVLLAAGPAGDVVRLADLGVAPLAGRPPASAAPEPVPGPADGSPVDGRADVHSLAALLFQLLTGERPGPGALAPSALRPGLPPELDGVVQRGLAADPDQRWTSAGGLAAAARAALALSGVEVARPADGPAGGTPGSGPPGPGTRSRRRAGAGALLGLAGLAAVLRWRGRPPTRRGERA